LAWRRVVDKKTWLKYTRENIVRSEKERERSDKLMIAMDTYMRSAAVELNAIFNQVNHVLGARVRETTDIKGKLQEHLNEVSAVRSLSYSQLITGPELHVIWCISFELAD